MKTTLDLPNDLLKAIKQRAKRTGIPFDDAVEVLLRGGLIARSEMSPDRQEPSTLTKDKKTGLPLIECAKFATASEEMTPERVADFLLAPEAGWHNDLGR